MIHGYKVGTRDDPYRLTRREKELYETGEWLAPKPLERNAPGLLGPWESWDNIDAELDCLDHSRRE